MTVSCLVPPSTSEFHKAEIFLSLLDLSALMEFRMVQRALAAALLRNDRGSTARRIARKLAHGLPVNLATLDRVFRAVLPAPVLDLTRWQKAGAVPLRYWTFQAIMDWSEDALKE